MATINEFAKLGSNPDRGVDALFVSPDERIIYFGVQDYVNLSPGNQLFVASRTDRSLPFDTPTDTVFGLIRGNGHAGHPSVRADGNELFFWCSDQIYRATRELPEPPANVPPVAVIVGPDVVEATGPAGTEVTLDGSGSYDPDSSDTLVLDWFDESANLLGSGPTLIISLPLNATGHLISLVVSDSQQECGVATKVVRVIDTTPPQATVTVTPDSLWPRDHKMREVTCVVTATDLADSNLQIELLSIRSNEADNAIGVGDGNTSPDIQAADGELSADDTVFLLRAECQGTGNDRLYTITYRVSDDSGNSVDISCIVSVPHDQGKNDQKNNGGKK